MAPAKEKWLLSRLNSRHTAIRKQPKRLDPLASSPSFQLLCKLFVPTKYWKKTDKLTSKQLSTYLPIIVAQHPDVNFDLHLLLASITNKFVASWYFGKLKTDNFEFLQLVYNCLSHICTDLTARCLSASDPDKIYELVDEILLIFNEHISQVDQLRSQINNQKHMNTDEKNEKELVESFLRLHHLFFVNRTDYLQALSSQLIDISFANSEINPTSSALISSFCTVLVADTILGKLVDKLSQPKLFMLLLAKTLTPRQKVSKPKVREPFSSRLSAWYLVYTSAAPKYDIIHSPLWTLVNTVTGITGRKPIMAALLESVKQIASLPVLNRYVASLSEYWIRSSIHKLQVFLEPSVCSWVQNLKRMIEEDNDEEISKDEESLDADSLSKLIVTHGIVQKLSPFIAYANESDSDIHHNIYGVISLFDNLETNKLLVMRLLDAVIAHMYPEMCQQD